MLYITQLCTEKLLWLLCCLLRSIFHILCSLRMLYILRSIFYVWYDDILQVIYYVSPSYVIYLYITYHMMYNCILWICHTIYNYISYCEYATQYTIIYHIVNMPLLISCILWICHTIIVYCEYATQYTMIYATSHQVQPPVAHSRIVYVIYYIFTYYILYSTYHMIYNCVPSGATTGCALAYSICGILHITYCILHIIWYIIVFHQVQPRVAHSRIVYVIYYILHIVYYISYDI